MVVHYTTMMDEGRLYRLVGERVKRARMSAGLSQAKLAKKLGMSRTSVVNIEIGRQRPPLHVLWDIATYLGTEVVLLIPSEAEYLDDAEPLKLDPETVARIEQAASGDSATRRDLTQFIARAVARNVEQT